MPTTRVEIGPEANGTNFRSERKILAVARAPYLCDYVPAVHLVQLQPTQLHDGCKNDRPHAMTPITTRTSKGIMAHEHIIESITLHAGAHMPTGTARLTDAVTELLTQRRGCSTHCGLARPR